MSYEGGGTIIGPTGATGPTGPAGGAFSGPTGAILWFDGSAVTGTTALVYDGFSTISSQPSNNYITLDGMGGIVVSIDETNVGKFVNIFAGAAEIDITDRITGEDPKDSLIQLTSDTLTLTIGATAQSAGQVLTSDGTNASWQTPSTILACGLASFDGTASPTTAFYIPISSPLAGFNTTTTAVQVTLQEPDDAPNEQNWIVFAKPVIDGNSDQFIQVVFASPVESAAPVATWSVLAVNASIVPAATSIIS
jgi:hypothetical protein